MRETGGKSGMNTIRQASIRSDRTRAHRPFEPLFYALVNFLFRSATLMGGVDVNCNMVCHLPCCPGTTGRLGTIASQPAPASER